MLAKAPPHGSWLDHTGPDLLPFSGLMNSLHVALVSAEVTPFVKTGGLGDIAGALPRALAKLGHRTTVFVPRYRSVKPPEGDWDGSTHVRVDAVDRIAGYYRCRTSPSVDTVFIEHAPFFDRGGGPYGDALGAFDDNHLRFAFLSRAAIEYFRMRGERPSVFHANDWHTGLLPVYLKAMYWSDPLLAPHADRLHHPQPRLPGELREERARRRSASPATSATGPRSSSTPASAT